MTNTYPHSHHVIGMRVIAFDEETRQIPGYFAQFCLHQLYQKREPNNTYWHWGIKIEESQQNSHVTSKAHY
jgi:hypothetical protein